KPNYIDIKQLLIMDLILNALRVLTFRNVYGGAAAAADQPGAEHQSEATPAAAGSATIDKPVQQQKRTRKTLACNELTLSSEVEFGIEADERSLEAWPSATSPLEKKTDLETAPQADLETAPQADLETAPQADLETAPQADLEIAPQANLETAPQADLETAPQANLETAPQADLETAPQADLETDTKEAPPLQQLYKKLLSMAKPLRWNSDGCSLINPRHHPAESAVSFQLVCPGSGYLISVTVGQEAPPDGPLSVACDPAVPELAAVWERLAQPGAAASADSIVGDCLLPATAGLA
ncbi:hypothetical protein BOX15_Mlig022475g2, partial [Macrostomum lignano]